VVKPVEPKPEEWTGTNWEKVTQVKYNSYRIQPHKYDVYSAGTPPNVVYYGKIKQTNQFSNNPNQQYPSNNSQLQQPETTTEPKKPGIKQKLKDKFGKRIGK
jgi:hypothetical protein